MLLPLVLTFAFAGAPQKAVPTEANVVAPAVIESKRKELNDLTDRDIEKQLVQILAADPEKRVCVRKTTTFSRMPRRYCATMRQWFNLERDRDSQALIAKLKGGAGGYDPAGGNIAAPPELINYVRERVRKPRLRAVAAEQAQARLSGVSANRAASPSMPPISNP